MKKIISVMLIAAAMLMRLASCSQKTDWEYIGSKGTLKIGVTIFKPMNYKDENNNWVGFETEFAQAVSEKLGVKAEFVKIDWSKKVVELKSKTIDCVWNGMTVKEELKAEMDMSQSYMNNWQVVVIRKADAEKYTTLESMAGAKTVAESESAGESTIKANEGLAKNYTSVDSQVKALMEVKSGTADIAVVDYVMAKSSTGDGTDYSELQMVEGIEQFSYEEYAIGFRKNSPETVKKVNDAINALIADGTLNKIAEKYGVAPQLISNQKG